MNSPTDMQFSDTLAAAGAMSARTPQEKVAILLLALGNPMGTKLLQSFDPSDVKNVMNSASALGPINRDDLESLVDDFAAQFAKTLGLDTGFENVKNLVEQAFTPDQINSMLGDAGASARQFVWRKFSSGSENALVPYLLDEHPQTIAYILSNLDSDLAARCIAMLPRELRDTAARRLLKLQQVGDRQAQLAQECLQEDILSRSDNNLEEEGRNRVAALMNKLDRTQSAAIIESLAASRPEEAKRLRGMIFSFEDIERLSQVARLSLFDKVQAEQVIPAIRGMPAEFKEAVLSSMGARARRMIESELTGLSDQVTKEGLAARRAIADLALAMATRGEIVLPVDENA